MIRLAKDTRNALRCRDARCSHRLLTATAVSTRSQSTSASQEFINTRESVTKNVPELKHVRSFPLVGSTVPRLSDTPGDIRKAYSYWPAMREKYGDFYTMGLPSFGNSDGIVHVIMDPREMSSVIRSGGSYPSGVVESLWVNRKWNESRGIASKGLLERGPEWKRVRTFMQTDLLHPESARGYVPGMIKAAELASAGAPASKSELNPYIQRCVLDLFSTVMFGEITAVADPTTPTDPQNVKFAREAAAGLGTSVEMLTDPYETIMHKLGITTSKCQFCFAAFDATWEIAESKIDSFIERKERNELTENEQNSYLFRALERQNDPDSQVTVEEVKEICFTGLFAAIDATSSVMGWNLFHVASNEDVQARLYNEVARAVEKFGDNGKLTPAVLSRENVAYLHAVLRETQRMTPPSCIFVNKHVDKDGLTVHGETLSKGDSVFLEGYSIGVDPKLVENPEEFRPERWLPEAVAARKGTPQEIIDHPFLKEPFSQGARKCPGSRVAVNEIHVLLSQWVLDWKIQSPINTLEDAKYIKRTMVEVQMPELQFEARH